MQAAIKVEGSARGGGPRQYRRAEVEAGGYGSRGEARGRRPETIQEGGGRAVIKAEKGYRSREPGRGGMRPETIQEGGGRGGYKSRKVGHESQGAIRGEEARDNTGGRR